MFGENFQKDLILNWSKELLDRYDDKWNWDEISQNTAIDFNEELVIHFHEFWKKTNNNSLNLWMNLFKNNSVRWTSKLLKFYLKEKNGYFKWSNYDDLKYFIKNSAVIWSNEFFEINFSLFRGSEYHNKTIAVYLNINIPWTNSLIIYSAIYKLTYY